MTKTWMEKLERDLPYPNASPNLQKHRILCNPKDHKAAIEFVDTKAYPIQINTSLSVAAGKFYYVNPDLPAMIPISVTPEEDSDLGCGHNEDGSTTYECLNH